MSRFKKVKYDGTTVTLISVEERTKWEREETFTCREAPHPDFLAALGALKGPMLDLCELEEEYGIGLDIRGVSFSQDDDGNKGVVVTALKKLDTVPAPMVLNTPHVSERPNADGESTMPDDLDRALRWLEKEAIAYKDGKRAQAELFDEKAEQGELQGVE